MSVNKPDCETLRKWAEPDEGLEPEMATDLTTDWFECSVIEARIQDGASPENDDFVLPHDHYDSWYVGIIDNATGDAGRSEQCRQTAVANLDAA